MDERPDLAGRESFLDPTDKPEPIEPPFVAGGPYDVDLGMVPGTRSTEDRGGEYGFSGQQPSSPSDELEAQRAQVEQTRAEMGDTIDAIQERLRPGNLAQQAKETIKGATVVPMQDAVSTATDTVQQAAGTATDAVQHAASAASTAAQEAASSTAGKVKEMGSAVVGTIKQHPVPVAFVGIGLGWLVAGARKQHATHQPPSARSQSYTGPEPSDGSAGEGSGGSSAQVVRQARETAHGAVAQASQLTTQAQQQASQLNSQVQQQAQQTVRGFRHVMQQNPLAVGAVGVAVGAAIGLAIPETQHED